MGDFGHFASIGHIRMKNKRGRPVGVGVCIDAWGAGPFEIAASDGKVYRFEDSDQFGPLLVTKRDMPSVTQPAERSPFWRAHWLWQRQGRKVEGDGRTCVWREPKPTILKSVRRQLIVVEKGEPDGIELLDGKRVRFGNIDP